MHGAAEKAYKDRAGQRERKQGKFPELLQADQRAVRGVRRLLIFDKEDPRLCERRSGNDQKKVPRAMPFSAMAGCREK